MLGDTVRFVQAEPTDLDAVGRGIGSEQVGVPVVDEFNPDGPCCADSVAKAPVRQKF